MIRQSNCAVVTVNRIFRDGKKFEASAKFSGVRGDASGTADPNGRFKFNIDWDNGSVGVYTAFIDEDGQVLDGRTYDKTHPESWATFTTDPIACDD